LQRGKRIEILIENRIESGVGALRGGIEWRVLRLIRRWGLGFSSHRKI